MVLTSLSLDYVVSDEKHYGPFVCGICKGLCSLDVVITPTDSLYCRDCLKNYLQKTISQDGRALDPVSKEDLKEADENDTIMVVENIPIRAKSLKISQSLAYILLMNVQVKGTPKGSKQEWIGDYKDYHKQLNGILDPSPAPSAPKQQPARGTSVERPSVYEDDMSKTGTTVRGEPTAAHHLRSMPQHADAGSVNLPDIERAMSRCDKLKKQANAKFNRGDIEGARMLYSEGLALISVLPVSNDTVRMMMASLYSNRAVTFFRERILPQSLEDCNKSLELDRNAEKTYIRKWRTLSAMEERDEGIACLHVGIERLPDSHKLQDELRKAMAPGSSMSKMDHKNNDDFSVSEMTKMTTPVGGYDLPNLGGGEPSPAAIERSDRLKKQANAKFNKGEIESARQLYSDAIGCIPPGGKYSHEVKTSLSMLYSNRAVTFFRDKMYSESLSDCEKAIDFDPTAEKGYIRKARALIGLERMQEAFDSLQDGSTKLPNSKKIAEELRKSEFDGMTPSAPEPKPMPAQKRFSNDYDRPTSQGELDSSAGSFNYFVSPGTSKTAAQKIKKGGADEDFSYELELSDKLKRNANAKFNRGDITGARLLYTEALGCLPDDTANEKVRSTLAALYANRAVTFFREKEFGPSTWDCDKAIELDPKSEKSYIRKSRALAALSRYDDAIDCLEKGLEVLPASTRLREELSKCVENGDGAHESRMELSVTSGIDYMSVSSMGNNTTGFLLTPKDARSVLGSVAEGSTLEVPFSGDEDVERAEKLKKQANAKLNKGDVAGARQLYGQGLEYLPKNPDNRDTRELAASLYANRAVTFFREKKFAATVLDCDKSLELDGKHEKSYIRKWRALMALGSFHDAFKCLEDALVAIPGSKRLEEELEAATEQRDLLNNANELIENGDYEGAREAMLPIVNSTDNVSLWLAAARADAYLGITDSAMERVNKVLMFNPNHLEGLQVRGYALFLSGEMEQGMSILKESLEVDIDNTEVSTLLQNCQKIYSNFSKGQARVKRGRYREAVDLFTTALESSDTIPIDAPLYSLMLTERAEASLLNHDYEDALEDCAEAIDLKQDNVTAWTVKVEVYFAQGRLQDARDELAEARKSWGAGNDTIEDAYKKTDFELRLQRADDDLRKIAAAVDTGEIPDIPDGEPLHFNMENIPKSSAKPKKREKSVERREKSSKKSSSDRKEHKRKKRSSSSGRRTKSTDKQ